MTRIDLTTRQWHELIKPVLPHVSTDPEVPELAAVRIECAASAVYAVATDRRTIAAERFPLNGGARLGTYDIPGPVHVRASEAKASLAMFPFSKDFDPPLRLTIDRVLFPIRVAGRPDAIERYAVTLEADDGTRLVMHDHRDPSSDPISIWRKHLAGILNRPQAAAAPALNFHAVHLARWAAACRKGERLAFFTGSKGDQSVLVAVESHFLGAWMPVSYLESPAEMLASSPWRDELDEVPWLAQASGVGATTIDIGPGAFDGTADPDGPPPWVPARLLGKCSGCHEPIGIGDEIQADGSGGWVCRDCGTGDDDQDQADDPAARGEAAEDGAAHE